MVPKRRIRLTKNNLFQNPNRKWTTGVTQKAPVSRGFRNRLE